MILERSFVAAAAQTAVSPFSSVRMRTACSTAETKTLPSPILPVLAALTMVATAASTCLSVSDEFELDLGQEVHGVFAAAVDFGVALLAAEALDFGDGHALDADFAEGVFDFFELEGLDDGFNFLHSVFLLVGARGCPDQSARRLLHGLAAPGSGVCALSNGSATQLTAWQHRQERLDFIEEEKSFERLVVSLERDRCMTRIAQPEQMAAAGWGNGSQQSACAKKRRRTPSVSAAVTNPTTTNHHIARQQTQIAEQNYSRTAPRFVARTNSKLGTVPGLCADSDFFQQRRCHADFRAKTTTRGIKATEIKQ